MRDKPQNSNWLGDTHGEQQGVVSMRQVRQFCSGLVNLSTRSQFIPGQGTGPVVGSIPSRGRSGGRPCMILSSLVSLSLPSTLRSIKTSISLKGLVLVSCAWLFRSPPRPTSQGGGGWRQTAFGGWSGSVSGWTCFGLVLRRRTYGRHSGVGDGHDAQKGRATRPRPGSRSSRTECHVSRCV